jgi:hypothetical protein
MDYAHKRLYTSRNVRLGFGYSIVILTLKDVRCADLRHDLAGGSEGRGVPVRAQGVAGLTPRCQLPRPVVGYTPLPPASSWPPLLHLQVDLGQRGR